MGVFFFRNVMFLMTSVRFVCSIKTDELNQTLMKRRSLAELKQTTFLLWVFLLSLKTKIKLENTTEVSASTVNILLLPERKLQNSTISHTIVEKS